MTNLARVFDATGFPMSGSIDRVWDNLFESSPLQRQQRGLSYELKSDDEAVMAEVEVPGVAPEDVKVRVEGRALLVETPRGNAYFTVGSRVDSENVTATVKNGLLSLRVPKREAKKVEVVVEVEES